MAHRTTWLRSDFTRLALNAWFWHQPGTGSGQYTRQLVKALAALEPGLDIRLVFPAPGGYRAVTPAEAGDEPPAWRPTNLDKLRFEQFHFPQAVKALGAGLAHVPYWASPLDSAAPLIVTVHDIIPRVLREYRGGPLVRAYTGLVSSSSHPNRSPAKSGILCLSEDSRWV